MNVTSLDHLINTPEVGEWTYTLRRMTNNKWELVLWNMRSGLDWGTRFLPGMLAYHEASRVGRDWVERVLEGGAIWE